MIVAVVAEPVDFAALVVVAEPALACELVVELDAVGLP